MNASSATPTDLAYDVEIDGDPAAKERAFFLILWLPFLLIPAIIVLIRLLKFLWKVYKAKQLGKESDLLKDTLAELGLSLNANYAKQRQIRKIKKEQEQFKLFAAAAGEKISDVEANKSATLHSEDTEDGIAGIRNKADVYFSHIRQRTKQTWSDKWSPEAIRRVFSATKYGRIWMFFQVFCTAIAILNYILLTYSMGREDRNIVKRLDMALAFIFAIDYCIGMYTADDRLRFYLHPSSISDLLSIIPPFVYVLISDYVGFLGLLRILRASRILRTYRLVSFQESEVTRELTILGLTFINFLFLSTSVINALEVLQGSYTAVPATLKAWHDCLYYIMVTFSTIGFGDLTPQTVPSRILVMILILLVIIFVPLQTSKLAELYNSTNQYQRDRYTAKPINAHVILTGVITYSSIIDFCREYFVNDPIGHVVIISDEVPTMEIRQILRHPYYKSRLVYLCGSPLNLSDLKRCSANQATGIFFLNSDTMEPSAAGDDEQLKVTRGADAAILMQALVCKNGFPGLSIFAQVQDIRSQDLSSHCGCDRTLCIDEMKMTLLAKSCLVPGILTMIMNLVHTYKEVDKVLPELWKQEYHAGASHQLQSFRFPPGLINKSFSRVALSLLSAFGVTVFAIISKSKMILAPSKNYIVKNDDIAFCIVYGGDETILRVSVQFNSLNCPLNDLLITKSMKDFNIATRIQSTSNLIIQDLQSGVVRISEIDGSPTLNIINALAKSPTSPTKSNIPFKNHVILCGNMSARGVRHFVQTIRNSDTNTGKETLPIVCLMENVPTTLDGIWEDILKFERVYVIKGTPLKKTNLINAGISDCHCIVIFTAKGQDVGESQRIIPDSNSIFIVQMIQEEWPKANFIVDLVDGSNAKYFSNKDQALNLENIRMQSILNNYSLSIGDRLALYKKIRSTQDTNILEKIVHLSTGQKWKQKSDKDGMGGGSDIPETVTVQISGSSSSGKHSYIPLKDESERTTQTLNNTLEKLEQEVVLNETGLSPFPVYHFDKHFAAGMVSTSSFTHSLLCQSYFRPFLIDMVKMLILNIIQLPVPEELEGKMYADLFSFLLEKDYMSLGLYRHAIGKDAPGALSYVYTNPKMSDIVHSSDLVFVLRSSFEK